MQFVVANDPGRDFEPLQEAWEDDRLLADLRMIENLKCLPLALRRDAPGHGAARA